MAEIRAQLEHYVQTCEKLKLLRKETKELSEIRKKTEEEIKTFLKAKGFESITYKDYSIEMRTINKNEPLKRRDEKARALDVLRQHGIEEPAAVLDDLRRKPKIQVDTLRIA
jgi:hypothetical protein